MPTPPETRFWSKVNKGDPTACWEWNAYKDPNGYGRFKLSSGVILAHRFSFQIHNGTPPTDACVLHRCDNPKCVNPAHLMLGTQADNLRDMREKGRAASTEKTRHVGVAHAMAKLSEDDVRLIRSSYVAGSHEHGQRQLAKRFGVNQVTVLRILQRKTWQHVA